MTMRDFSTEPRKAQMTMDLLSEPYKARKAHGHNLKIWICQHSEDPT